MDYVIGIDCGGTNTRAVAYDLNGNELANRTMGFGNLVIDYAQAKTHIFATLEQIFTELGQQDCLLVALGVAGLDGGGFRERFEKDLTVFPIPIYLYNDAQFSYLAKLGTREGILLIAGTGSACFGLKGDTWYRVGGWGALLGDDGSAYDIGLTGIKGVLEEFDAGLEPSRLSREILDHFQCQDALHLVAVVYGKTKDEIAQVAQLVSRRSDDFESQKLLKEAGRKLAHQVLKLQHKMSIEHCALRLALNGSVVEKQVVVRQELLARLAPNTEIVPASQDNAVAALWVAQDKKQAQRLAHGIFH